jgi:hypothetical protein
MMNHDDDLDRMLFALPLEPVPEGLRASILSGVTALRAPFLSRFEVLGLGAILALTTWLCLSVAASSDGLREAFGFLGSAVVHFSEPAILLWVALGASTAVWLSLLSLPVRAGRRQRSAG